MKKSRRSFLKQTTLGIGAIAAFKGMLDYEGLNGTWENHEMGNMPVSEESVRIAVVQQDHNPGGVETNRRKALDSAKKALADRADVILFHEEMLVGYHEKLKELAEPIDGITSKAFQELLKGTGSLIIYGLTEKENDKYYISAPVVSEKGVIANYRKTHLWRHDIGLRHEPTYYTPGDKLVTFNIKGHKCGIMICYDGDFPEMTRSYANLGCSIVFWMNNRGSRGYESVKDLALRNSMIMAVSCCCGTNEKGNKCRGGSNITGPKGELITEIWDKEGTIMAEVHPASALELRKENYRYSGLRPDLYYYR